MDEPAAVIIPAAGTGSRMRAAVPKQYLELAGQPLLIHTIRAFLSCPFITQIIVAVPAGRVEETRALLTGSGRAASNLLVVEGGVRRQDSVQAGMVHLDPAIEVVLVHDGARPCVSTALIERCYRAIVASGAAIAAVPVNDTLKRAGGDKCIEATVDRSRLWQAQTPQGARTGLLHRAFAALGDDTVTDEASLLEAAAIPVKLVEGEQSNLKVTRQEDLLLAETIMRRHTPGLRTGHGFDAHRFTGNRPLILGGVAIEHHSGLAGHSDADVVTHALCDALLGAATLGDIGQHFPDSDPRYKDCCSLDLLETVMAKLATLGYRLVNADITVVCQAPKLAPHLAAMRTNLARCCRSDTDCINVKATTTERMGFTGRQEGISCHAVVLLGTSAHQRHGNEQA